MKRSYIKIYGPPVLKAIRALEKIAVDMPETCISDTILETMMPMSEEDTTGYFSQLDDEISTERCFTIISKSGKKVGEYDFYFEWFGDPSQDDLKSLIEKIDNALAPLGCRYTITTK